MEDRMFRTLAATGCAAALLLAVGAAYGAATTVHASMKDVIAPQGQALWDVTNAAMDDAGKPDASRISEEGWAKVAEAGRRLKEHSELLARARPLIVAEPGERLQDEGGPGGGAGAGQVQAYIDRDPEGFAEHAMALAALGGQAVEAAEARDARILSGVADSLDAACESCHQRFWYPPRAE